MKNSFLTILNLTFFLACLALTACNGGGGAAPFIAENPSTFSKNFSFATASPYTVSSNTIDFSNGYAELTSASQTDSSNIIAGFAGGSSIGTAYLATTSPSPGIMMLSQTGTPTNNSELDSSWAPEWPSIAGVWHLDGNYLDSSGQGNNAYAIYGSGWSYVTGKLNQGLNFIGAAYSAGLILPPVETSTTAATVAFWFNSTTLPTVTDALLISGGFTLSPAGGNSLLLQVFTDASTSSFVTAWNANDNFFDGKWHHLAFTLNNGAVALYKDGVLDNTGTYTVGDGLSVSSSPVTVFYAALENSFDEIAIWKTALSSTEIQNIYSRQSATYAGTFTSRVMDGLSTSAHWTNISWVPTLPFLKELPDNGASETQASYSSQTSNLMNGIVALWHLDEAAGTSGANTLKDNSGNANHGTPTGGVTFGESGQLGTSASLDGTGYFTVTNIASLNAPSAFTAAAWIKTSSANGVQMIMSKDPVFDLGVNWTSGKAQLSVTNNGGTVYTSGPSTTTVTDGSWHHVVGVFNGSVTSIYVDGVLENSQSSPITLNTTANIVTIGTLASNQNTENWNGGLDEVALWNRALGDGTNGSSNEILELYRRGANRIKYQIRTCTASDCSDDATNAHWIGPDNSNQTYFSELNNNLVQSDGGDLSGNDSVQAGLPTLTFSNFSGLTVPTHRYFQYRAIMESDDAGSNCNYGSGSTWCSPELNAVSAGPGHYDATAPTITNNTGIGYATLTNLVETLGTNGCSQGTLYNLSPDHTNWYYWTGAAWGLADGTISRANSAATIASNISTFATQVGTGSFYFKVFLQSSGTSACTIDSLSINGTL